LLDVEDVANINPNEPRFTVCGLDANRVAIEVEQGNVVVVTESAQARENAGGCQKRAYDKRQQAVTHGRFKAAHFPAVMNAVAGYEGHNGYSPDHLKPPKIRRNPRPKCH
jgi:hypothetical protein